MRPLFREVQRSGQSFDISVAAITSIDISHVALKHISCYLDDFYAFSWNFSYTVMTFLGVWDVVQRHLEIIMVDNGLNLVIVLLAGWALHKQLFVYGIMNNELRIWHEIDGIILIPWLNNSELRSRLVFFYWRFGNWFDLINFLSIRIVFWFFLL